MSSDRQLVDAIKAHFARKSSAQLELIVRTKDQHRWSPEAVTAAREVLQERLAGRALEPQVPEEDRPLQPILNDPYSLGFLMGVLGGLFGFGVIPVYRPNYAGEPEPDRPIPFGTCMAWLALDTVDTEAVAAALGLRDVRPATWEEGIPAANRSAIYVTPPLADWTLALGKSLFPRDRLDRHVKPLLERLSQQFGEAQFFCTHLDFELHAWALAREGQLVRGYGWLGEKELVLWNEGRPTDEERRLGFQFPDGQSSNENITVPNEHAVLQIAFLWSIDPMTLNEQFMEPGMGLLGEKGA